MKKFITNEELRDIVSELADKFVENSRYDVTISLSHYTSSDELKIQVQDCESSYKVVGTESYQIIEKPSDSFDVVRDIETAIEKHEVEMAKAKETESPIDLDCA